MKIVKNGKITKLLMTKLEWENIGYKYGFLKKNSSEGERSWVYIQIPKEFEKIIKYYQSSIDEDDLYFEEENSNENREYGIEKNLHITVKYGILTDNEKKVKNIIDKYNEGEKKVKIEKISIFKNEKYDVLKISCKSKYLKKIHDELSALENDDKHLEYEAHITLAYLKPGMGKKYENDTISKIENKIFTFNNLIFKNRKNIETVFELN